MNYKKSLLLGIIILNLHFIYLVGQENGLGTLSKLPKDITKNILELSVGMSKKDLDELVNFISKFDIKVFELSEDEKKIEILKQMPDFLKSKSRDQIKEIFKNLMNIKLVSKDFNKISSELYNLEKAKKQDIDKINKLKNENSKVLLKMLKIIIFGLGISEYLNIMDDRFDNESFSLLKRYIEDLIQINSSDLTKIDKDNILNYLLWTAIENDKEDLVNLLLKLKFNLNKTNSKGKSALIIATEKGNPEIVKLLIESKVDLNSQDKYGFTPLIHACGSDEYEIAKLLIQNNANLNIQSKEEGVTALIVASGMGNKEIVEMLLKAGADFNLKSICGKLSPLNVAIEQKHEAIIELLKKYGAKE